jgi:amidase
MICGSGSRTEIAQKVPILGGRDNARRAHRLARLIRWVAALCGLSLQDAHELVSQTCRLRIGNLVNPLYSVAAFVDKRWLPGAPVVFGGAHERLLGT